MTIASPCLDLCQMSEDQTVCTGCHRSLAEIANWSRLSDAEKLQVIATARQRGVASAGKLNLGQTP